MAGRESFDEFYAGAVGRLVGQLFPVTGNPHEAEGQEPVPAVERVLAFDRAGNQIAACRISMYLGNRC